MNSQYKRTRLLVNRRVQGRVLLRVLWLWGLYHFVLWNVMFFFRFMQYCGERLTGGQARTSSELFAEFFHNHYSLLICAVIVLPYLVWDVLKLTHRFVGPLVQFQRCLTRMTNGERPDEVKIRKHDFLGELQDSFNEFLRSPYAPGRDREARLARLPESGPANSIGGDAEAVQVDCDDICKSVRAGIEAAREEPARPPQAPVTS
jgi:hypothetical protein